MGTNSPGETSPRVAEFQADQGFEAGNDPGGRHLGLEGQVEFPVLQGVDQAHLDLDAAQNAGRVFFGDRAWSLSGERRARSRAISLRLIRS